MFGNYVGIDIDSDSIKLSYQNKTDEIKLPEKSIENGVVLNESKLGDVIKRLVLKHKLYGRRTAIVYNGPSIFSKIIKIPSMKNKEVRSYLKLEIENIIPFTVNEGVFDYIVLDNNKQFMEILIFALKNELINPIIKTVIEGGLQPIAIDIPGLALSRMLFKDMNKVNNDGLQLVIDVSNTTTDIHVYTGGTFRFSRTINIGNNDFNNILSADIEEKVFNETLKSFQKEITRSINYFKYRFDNQESKEFDKVLLLGVDNKINEIVNIIEEDMKIKCTTIDDPRYILAKGLSLWKQGASINLLPLNYRQEAMFKMKKIVLRSILAIFIISMIINFILIQINISKVNREIEAVESDINKSKSFLEGNKEELNSLQRIKDIVTSIEEVKSNSISHFKVLEDLRKHTPKDVKFRTLSMTRQELNLNAEASNLTSLSIFLDSLNAWDSYEDFFVSQINYRNGSYVFTIEGKRGVHND